MKKKWWKFLCIMLFALMLAACGADDEDDTRSSKKKDSKSKKSETVMELEAPSGLSSSYDINNAALTVVWSAVEGATDYEVDYGGSNYVSSAGLLLFRLSNPEEGATYVVKVRAVGGDDEDVIYSDWASVECAIPYCAKAPTAIEVTMDGTIMELDWPSVTGATAYEVIAGSAEGTVTNNNAYLQVQEGQTYSISVRTVREIASGTYYSDWTSVDYTVPQTDISIHNYWTAFLLDYNHLLEWAEANGYSYKVTQEDGYVLVDVYYKDELNSGFWSTVTRIVDSAVGAFIDSYISNTYDTYTNDFSSVESSLWALFESGGVKEYTIDVDNASTESGMESAIIYGVEALLLDTNIHCYYYYTDIDRAAFGSWCVLLTKERENYKEDYFGSFSPEEDGRYHLVMKSTGQPLVVDIAPMKLNSFDYWSVISMHE